MTDSEKELRRMAQAVTQWDARTYVAYADAAEPAAILALLDRIEALERQVEDQDARIADMYERNTELKERCKDLAHRLGE